MEYKLFTYCFYWSFFFCYSVFMFLAILIFPLFIFNLILVSFPFILFSLQSFFSSYCRQPCVLCYWICQNLLKFSSNLLKFNPFFFFLFTHSQMRESSPVTPCLLMVGIWRLALGLLFKHLGANEIIFWSFTARNQFCMYICQLSFSFSYNANLFPRDGIFNLHFCLTPW